MIPNLQLKKDMTAKTPEEQAFVDNFGYLAAVGELLYLSLVTRNEIARAVAYLCRFSANPGPAHCQAVKHLWRYLKGTIDLKLTYAPTDSPDPVTAFYTYSDADHGGCSESGKSTSGYALMMGTGAVSWSSKLQSIVALSTTEAEYVAACSAGQEIIWMRSLLSELGYAFTAPTRLLMDNQSALQVAKNPEHHGRMKHLDLRYFWLRHQIQSGAIKPEYVPTQEMAADMLTKSLPKPAIEKFRRMMGLM
jgi:hypothetical protein